MKLFVDDIRIAPDGWVQAWTADEAILLLSKNAVTDLSLDHDLGESSEKTGYDVMLWIEKEVITNPRYVVPNIKFHTANPVGRANMIRAYKSILARL